MACGILATWSGIKPHEPCIKTAVLRTEPPGKSPYTLYLNTDLREWHFAPSQHLYEAKGKLIQNKQLGVFCLSELSYSQLWEKNILQVISKLRYEIP